MDKQTGYNIIAKEMVKHPQIQNTNQALWHIRGCNTPGMIAIDYIFFVEKVFQMRSMRFLYTQNQEFVCANNMTSSEVQNALKSMIHITAETAIKYIDPLINAINNTAQVIHNNSLNFEMLYLINPGKDIAITSKIYSGYAGEYIQIELTPDIKQAISCEISGEIFIEPMTMKVDIENVFMPNHQTYTLRRGRSYEKALLEKSNVDSQFFCFNYTLKHIVDRIGSLQQEKITMLTKDTLKDPISLECFEKPVILPSGQTISQESFFNIVKSGNLECPLSRRPFEIVEVVSNVNVLHFLQAWPRYKYTLLTFIESLQYQQPAEINLPTEMKQAGLKRELSSIL